MSKYTVALETSEGDLSKAGTTLQVTEREGKKALVLEHSQTDYVFLKR